MRCTKAHAAAAKPSDLRNAFYVYHFDEAYTSRARIESFGPLLNYLLLCADHVVILDSFVLNNGVLASLMERSDYGYLTEGLVVPARRTVGGALVPFGSLHERQEKTKHIYLTRNALHVQRLDSLPHTCVGWELSAVADSFERGVYALQEELLRNVRLQQLDDFRGLVTGQTLQEAFAYATADRELLGDRSLARIHFDHYMQEADLPGAAQRALKRFIDAVHCAVMPEHLGLSSFYPYEFESLLGPIRNAGRYLEARERSGRLEVSLLDQATIPALPRKVLEQLDLRDLLALRATDEFEEYQRMLAGGGLDMGVVKRYWDAVGQEIVDPKGFAKERMARTSRVMLWRSKHGLLATILDAVVDNVPWLSGLTDVLLYWQRQAAEGGKSPFEPLLTRELISGIDLGADRPLIEYGEDAAESAHLLLPQASEAEGDRKPTTPPNDRSCEL